MHFGVALKGVVTSLSLHGALLEAWQVVDSSVSGSLSFQVFQQPQPLDPPRVPEFNTATKQNISL